ncbi:PREDICTED: uncharacterized protein LOC109160648 [Ipomoea nil]|uniref:uncharacterized protein LOC109160648 n=1 Tax=Ipomoea nil TaxID=35883 RepID=UPI00090187A0|nr:PREDICTED: uncharacterized protein LOC109160648 [Ipomoea nil]
MKIAVEVKNKWGIIIGSVAAPARENAQYASWRRCNLMVCAWIFKSVHISIAQSIMHLDRAKEVWEDLEWRFAQCDAQKISALQNEIFNLQQGNRTVNDYYTKCHTLWEEMNALIPFPICKWNPKCSCNLVDEIRKERDTDQVIRFLQGLGDDYNSLKSNVLVLDPLPEVYKVFVMAEKLERQITLTNMNLNSIDLSQENAVQHEQGFMNEIVAAVNSYNAKRNASTNRGANVHSAG